MNCQKTLFFNVSFIVVYVKIVHIVLASFSFSFDTFTVFKTKKASTPGEVIFVVYEKFVYIHSYCTFVEIDYLNAIVCLSRKWISSRLFVMTHNLSV